MHGILLAQKLKCLVNQVTVTLLLVCYRYALRGKVRDEVGGAKLSFELEVCRVPRLDVVGIRRKRLKGDAWIYKRVCEEVLRLAQSNSSINTPVSLTDKTPEVAAMYTGNTSTDPPKVTT